MKDNLKYACAQGLTNCIITVVCKCIPQWDASKEFLIDYV